MRFLVLALAAVALDPCNGLGTGSDSGTSSTAQVDAAGAPVVDDVTVPETATIDVSTGVAHIQGSISFHSDTTPVTAVNVLAHGTSGSVYRGSLNGASPQPLIFDLSSAGAHGLDFNVQDQAGRTSAVVTRTIVVQE